MFSALEDTFLRIKVYATHWVQVPRFSLERGLQDSHWEERSGDAPCQTQLVPVSSSQLQSAPKDSPQDAAEPLNQGGNVFKKNVFKKG